MIYYISYIIYLMPTRYGIVLLLISTGCTIMAEINQNFTWRKGTDRLDLTWRPINASISYECTLFHCSTHYRLCHCHSSWTILMSPFQVAKETLFFVVQKHTWALPETLDQIFDERVSNWIDTLIKSYSIALLDLVGEGTNNCAWPLLCVLFFLGFAGENLGSELLRLRFVGLKRTLCFFKCNPTNFQSAVTFLPAFLKRFNKTCSIPPLIGKHKRVFWQFHYISTTYS